MLRTRRGQQQSTYRTVTTTYYFPPSEVTILYCLWAGLSTGKARPKPILGLSGFVEDRSCQWLSSSSSSCVEPTSSHVICFPAVRRPPTGFVAVSSSIPISHHLLLQQSTCITSPELSFLAHNSCHLSLYSFLLMHTIAIHNGTSIDTLSTTASIRGTCQKGSQRYPGTLRLTVGLDPGIIRG